MPDKDIDRHGIDIVVDNVYYIGVQNIGYGRWLVYKKDDPDKAITLIVVEE